MSIHWEYGTEQDRKIFPALKELSVSGNIKKSNANANAFSVPPIEF